MQILWLLSDILPSRSPENRKMVERWQKKYTKNKEDQKFLQHWRTMEHNKLVSHFRFQQLKRVRLARSRAGQTREVTSCLGLNLLSTAPWWWAELALKSSVSSKYVTSSKLHYLYIIIYCIVLWGTQRTIQYLMKCGNKSGLQKVQSSKKNVKNVFNKRLKRFPLQSFLFYFCNLGGSSHRHFGGWKFSRGGVIKETFWQESDKRGVSGLNVL